MKYLAEWLVNRNERIIKQSQSKKQPKTDPLDRGQDIKPKNTFTTDDLKSNNGKPSKPGKSVADSVTFMLTLESTTILRTKRKLYLELVYINLKKMPLITH